MGFSCEIRQGKKAIGYSYLYYLAPSSSDDTDAPYRQEDLRRVVSMCVYGHKLKEAAQDAFKELQEMVRANVNSLKPCHCDTCACEEETPRGWKREVCQEFLDIDPKTITYLSGGY